MIKLQFKIESTLNSLLRKSYPNKYHEFRLFKLVSTNYEYKDSFSKFKEDLKCIYSAKSSVNLKIVDHYLNIKLSEFDLRFFILGFHNSDVDALTLRKAAFKLVWLFKNEFTVSENICNEGVFLSVLSSFFKPQYSEIYKIDMHGFIDAWRQFVFTKFGEKYEDIFTYLNSMIEKELASNLEIQMQNKELLTQTQIDWVIGVKKSLDKMRLLPNYPLGSEIDAPQLKNINQHVRLYNLLYSKRVPLQNFKAEKIISSLNLLCKEVLGGQKCQRY